jgi:hypothetical protein
VTDDAHGTRVTLRPIPNGLAGEVVTAAAEPTMGSYPPPRELGDGQPRGQPGQVVVDHGGPGHARPSNAALTTATTSESTAGMLL